MSRFVSALPTLPPLGAEFALNPATGFYDVTGDVPQPLSGPLFASDLAILVRDTGPAGAPNPVPFSVTMGAVLTGGTVLFAAQPTATRIYQRDTRTGGAFGLGAGTVGVFVTLSAAATSLDYRLRDAATPATVLQDWMSLAGATPAGSASLTPAIPAGPHRYLMDVRASGDAAHAVLGTQAFGVGEVIGVAGQSLGTNMLVAGWSPEGTIASAGVTPAANGYVFAPSEATTDGNTGTAIAPNPTQWATPADGTAYCSAFAAEFLRLVTGQAGVVAALVGFTSGGSSITQWQPGQPFYATLLATLDQAGKIGALIWMQGHSDAQNSMGAATYQGLLATLMNALAARYAGPGGTVGAFPRLICSIPSLSGTYWGQPSQIIAIRAGALAYVTSDARARYVAALDMGLSSDGTHPSQAGRVPMARDFYRAFMGVAGLVSEKPGPAITGATRAAGSAVIKLAVAQGAGGAALVAVGTPANQFTVYPAGSLSTALTIASLTIAGPTEIDLTLAATPADGQPLDVWYRLSNNDTPAVTGSGIYDDATDADGLTPGRQLQLVAAAITVPAIQGAATADLTMTGATYGTSAAGFGQQLTGGSGTAAVALPAGALTLELWFTGSPVTDGNLHVLASLSSGALLCLDQNGAFFVASGVYGGGGHVVTNGAPHHLALVVGADGAAMLFVDGAVDFSLSGTSGAGGSNSIAISAAGGTNAGYTGWGSVDEVRLSTGKRYTAAFTVPSAPFTSDASTVFLAHLDGSGAATAGVTAQPAAVPAAFTVRSTSQAPVPSAVTVPVSGTGAVSASVQVYTPDGTNLNTVAFAITSSSTTAPAYGSGDDGVNAGDFQDFAAALGGVSPPTFTCSFKIYPNGNAAGTSRTVYLWAFNKDSSGNYLTPVVMTGTNGAPVPITVSYQ